MMARLLSNISGEATSRFGNIFNEAMLGSGHKSGIPSSIYPE
jgi:hypothetical protein